MLVAIIIRWYTRVEVNMSESFVQWRNSSQVHFNNESFVISDSEDEDIVQSSFNQRLLIDESNEDSADVSYTTQPK